TGDLRLTLISPTNQRFLLFDQRPTPFGGDPGNPGLGPITFDDNAAQSLAQGSPPYSGTFQPEDALAALIGSNPNGQWTLEVADLFTGGNTDFGTLSSWSLTITPGVLSASSNPGNFMDQNADGRTLENPSQGNPGDVYAIPQPLNGLPGKLPYS